MRKHRANLEVTKVGALRARLVPPSPFTSTGFDLNLKGRSSSAVAVVFHFTGLVKLMSFKYRDKKAGMAAIRTYESGFSMIELMIVCVIMVIIAGIAVPNIFRTYRNYQLDAAGHSVASLLQQARMQAVKTNLPAYAIATNDSAFAYVASTPTGAYVNGSPDVGISTAVTFQPPDTTGGFHTQLDTYLQGTPLVGTALVPVSIGFNARGLPCTSAGNPTVCTPPVGTNGFIWFMQSAGGWEAVTVTASGRIKSWRLNSQSNGVTTWQ